MRGSALLIVFVMIAVAFAGGSLLSCSFCSTVVDMGATFGTNKTLAGVVGALDKACQSMGNGTVEKACVDLANAAGKALAHLPAFVESGEYPPRVICSILFDGVCPLPCCVSDADPEQVYITFGKNAQSVVRVNWVTLNATKSFVQWGSDPNSLAFSSIGDVDTYTNGGWLGTLHSAYMTNLDPGVRVWYAVGDGQRWSKVFR